MAAKVHYVAKARKDNQAVKKGEPYWWWKPHMRAGKRYFARKPRRSQVTTSDYLSALYSIQEQAEDAEVDFLLTEEDFVNFRDEIESQLEELRQETEEKLENMPEGLREGDTGQLIEERINACEAAVTDIQQIEFDDSDIREYEDSDDEEGSVDEDALKEYVGGLIIEISDALESCDV